MRKIILFALFLLFLSCDTTENRVITFKNNHHKDVYYFYSNKEMNSEEYVLNRFYPIMVEKDSLTYLNVVRPQWEEYLDKSPGKKLKVFIVEKDSVEKYGWEILLAKKICNKRYDLTIDDLEKSEWEIIYN